MIDTEPSAGPFQQDLAAFLDEVCEVLTERGTVARELAAVEFNRNGKEIAVFVRDDLHGAAYPELDTIFADIGRTCAKDRVAVAQLRRITFLDREIKVELTDGAGATVRVYSIRLGPLDS